MARGALIKTKECRACGFFKPIEDFVFNKLAPNKRHYLCGECESKFTHFWGVSYTKASIHPKYTKEFMYKNPDLLEANRIMKGVKKLLKNEGY